LLPLVLAFIDIALHRRGPEQLPASSFLLGFVLVVYLVVAFATLRLDPPAANLTMLLVAGVMLYAGFVWAVLKAFKHEKRFMQTAIALLGTDTLFNVMSLPLLWLNRPADETTMTLPGLLLLIVFFWSIDVSGFVLSRAIGRPYVVGVGIMVGYVLLSISLRASLFPATATT
jgi:hypothetical protein